MSVSCKKPAVNPGLYFVKTNLIGWEKDGWKIGRCFPLRKKRKTWIRLFSDEMLQYRENKISVAQRHKVYVYNLQILACRMFVHNNFIYAMTLFSGKKKSAFLIFIIWHGKIFFIVKCVPTACKTIENSWAKTCFMKEKKAFAWIHIREKC